MTRTPTKTVLHVGCAYTSVFDREAYRGHLLQFFENPKEWNEIRVDLDPAVEPDVVADAHDLPFEDESADTLVCLACLEHLTESLAGATLLEFHRVLRPKGRLILQVPNLELAAKAIVEGRCLEILYESDAGPVRALDLIYGHQQMATGNPLMSHRTGFTAGTLAIWLWESGFDGRVDSTDTDLWAYVEKIKEHERGENTLGCLYQSREPEPAAA